MGWHLNMFVTWPQLMSWFRNMILKSWLDSDIQSQTINISNTLCLKCYCSWTYCHSKMWRYTVNHYDKLWFFHNRGQFLSVWCRVICQHAGQGVKILAMLSPLYMIRSHLPVPAKVLIDTPGLKVHLEVWFLM